LESPGFDEDVMRLNGMSLLLSVVVLAGVSGAEEPIRVVTWNVLDASSPEAVEARRDQFAAAAASLRPSILVVQEVASHEVVAAIRDAMGLAGYHVACSNFAGAAAQSGAGAVDDPAETSGLEVGIISKYPIARVIEYDPSPDNRAVRGDVPELALQPDLKLGIPPPRDPAGVRGFLWVRLEEPRLTIAGVHLKSSRGVDGDEDLGNARLREFVTAAVAASVREDLNIFSDHTCVVAGDFNVGHADAGKNGRDLHHDLSAPLTDRHDGYDETHALMARGLAGGLRMRNLLTHTREPSYPSFPGSAIDVIYVVGPRADQFAPATIADSTFGSDHCPVVTELPPAD
jgi:endonuclease/exonuclease/phosphatase family metal-dependent hydrolase